MERILGSPSMPALRRNEYKILERSTIYWNLPVVIWSLQSIFINCCITSYFLNSMVDQTCSYYHLHKKAYYLTFYVRWWRLGIFFFFFLACSLLWNKNIFLCLTKLSSTDAAFFIQVINLTHYLEYWIFGLLNAHFNVKYLVVVYNIKNSLVLCKLTCTRNH